MRGVRGTPPDDDADKAARIERIVGDVVLQRRAGADVDDSAIVKQHSELEPELGRRLRALRVMEAVVQRAGESQSPEAPTPGSGSPFQEDLRFLREALTNYDILERVNYGGQGVVYKAIQRSTRRTVAIKVLLDGPLASEHQRRRFMREVELTSRLQHPNIVTLYESGVVRERVYCALEFIEGVPLDDYILLHGLSIVDIVRLFSTVVRAVSYAHQQGIIHRDLNPANVLVDLDGVPRVLDFGLAKDVWGAGAAQESSSLTMSGQVVGTLPYLSPEQAGAQDGEVDVRSDIYSLGVMLFELLTGGFPYPVDGSPGAVRACIVEREPLPLRKAMSADSAAPKPRGDSLTADLEAILLKALSKEKAHRYQSAAAFVDDLERSLAGEIIEARADRRHYLLLRTFRKYRAAVTVAGLLVLVVGAAAVAVTAMWVQARLQRDNARAMARVAIGTLDDVITRVDDSVRPLAGGTEVRDKLLNDVVAGRLAALRPLVESDAAMDDLRAALYERQGDIAYARGNHADAGQSYQSLLDLIGLKAQAGGPTDERLGVVARAERKLAGVIKDADNHFGQAIALGEALVNRRPDELAPKYELCKTHVEYGRHLYLRGQYELAAQQISAAREMAEPIVVSTGREEHWIEVLAQTYSWEGDIAVALGESERSAAALTQAVALCRELSEARPADVDRRRQLLVTCTKLGSVLQSDERAEEAKAVFEEAVSVGEYLIRVDPTIVAWRHDLFGAHFELAQQCLLKGDLGQGQPHCQAAAELAQQLMSGGPTNPTWRRDLASSNDLEGLLRICLREPSQACEAFETALRIREGLLVESPDDLALCKEVGMSHSWLGVCRGRLGDCEQALEHQDLAHSMAESLCALQPSVTQRAIDLVRAKTNLAAAHMKFRTPEHNAIAEATLRDAAELLEGLHSAGRLEGRPKAYTTCMGAISRNLEILARRAEGEHPRDDELSEGDGP